MDLNILLSMNKLPCSKSLKYAKLEICAICMVKVQVW